jgi:hypothetical protein
MVATIYTLKAHDDAVDDCFDRRRLAWTQLVGKRSADAESRAAQNVVSWNRVVLWMRRLASLSRASGPRARPRKIPEFRQFDRGSPMPPVAPVARTLTRFPC